MIPLEEALSALSAAVMAETAERKSEFEWLRSLPALATKSDLAESEKRIMSAIADMAAATTALQALDAASTPKP